MKIGSKISGVVILMRLPIQVDEREEPVEGEHGDEDDETSSEEESVEEEEEDTEADLE